MKKIIAFVFLSLSIFCNAQNVSVEKSVFGIQNGLLGIWAYNESRLSNTIALRCELGLGAAIWYGSFYDEVGFSLSPVLTLEPRFYYNLNKRNSRSKGITNNSGNFISIKTSYYPGWFVISNYEYESLIKGISIIPTWGIRRNIGAHFNFEAGAGIGYQYFFTKAAGYPGNEGDAAANLLLRFGYVF